MLTDLQQLGAFLHGTTHDTTTPTLGALLCMGFVALTLDELAPLPVPDAYGVLAWLAVQVVLTLLLIVLLHALRPRHDGDPPRGFGTSYDRAAVPIFVAYLGLSMVRYGLLHCYTGDGGLGMLLLAAIGALLVLGGLAAGVHNVLRRF